MAETLYKDTTYNVSLLVQLIQAGKIALPDIQRPFVWQAGKVRALFDSMYKGFPVGNLLFWETGADPKARQIGTSERAIVPNHLIVDGQQRLTSLFAVMTGSKVVRDDYSEAEIRIAFRPADGTFAVTDAAIEKDPEYIANISPLWQPGGKRPTVKAYLKAVAARREVDEAEEDRLESAINRLIELWHYPFRVVELSSGADDEQVAEIFVRINSEGVTLVQADFILTLMSVFWEKGRQELEQFCRACRLPALTASPFNWYIQPQPAQLLRTTVAIAFRRAVLKHIYTVLRGKELDTGKLSAEQRDTQFAKLATAQEHVLDLTNWHEFLLCMERAGFRGKKMISSENAVIFSYALWLIGRVDYGVPLDRLREVIARWFFMAHATARYSGSFETQVERDLGQLNDLASGDTDGFIATLSKIVDDTLTTDYWKITLPNELASSASKSPALLAYIAALNIVDADALLSTTSVRARLDPAVTSRKGIERHHLFPRAYLHKQGVSDAKRVNQIANMALVDWYDNIAISDQPPATYWPDQLGKKHLPKGILAEQARWHALPDDWTSLPYDTFLARRRVLMADVVRTAFHRLADRQYSAAYPAPSPVAEPASPARRHYSVRVTDLLDAGLLTPDIIVINPTDDVEASIRADGSFELDGTVYDSPSGASDAAHGGSTNGWNYWYADTPNGLRNLATLREDLLKAND